MPFFHNSWAFHLDSMAGGLYHFVVLLRYNGNFPRVWLFNRQSRFQTLATWKTSLEMTWFPGRRSLYSAALRRTPSCEDGGQGGHLPSSHCSGDTIICEKRESSHQENLPLAPHCFPGSDVRLAHPPQCDRCEQLEHTTWGG